MKIRSADDLRRILRQKREDQGLSQSQIADRIGRPRQTIGNFENDRTNTSLDVAFDYLRALEGTLDVSFASPDPDSDSNESERSDNRSFGAMGH